MSDKVARILIYVLSAEDVAVAAAYLLAGRYAHAVYWGAAAVICFSTLFLR